MTIDYDRMKRRGPVLKAALTRAGKDPVKVRAACVKAVKEWDEIGCWPDNWTLWAIALWDAGINEDLDDLR